MNNTLKNLIAGLAGVLVAQAVRNVFSSPDDKVTLAETGESFLHDVIEGSVTAFSDVISNVTKQKIGG